MKKTPPIPFAGSQLGEARHVCAFFNSDDEEYRVLLPFIQGRVRARRQGGSRRQSGSTSTTICNGWLRQGSTRRPPSESGQFELRTNTETYLRDGRFDQDRMLEVFEQIGQRQRARADFRSVALSATWTGRLKDGSHIDDLVEFESRVNDVWRRHDDAVICAYDLAKFGAETVIDIMRTHPMIIIGGILQQNPFFVPPEAVPRESFANGEPGTRAIRRQPTWKCNSNIPRGDQAPSALHQ